MNRDQYIQALKSHDWYYQYSDDHRVYMQGYNSEVKLRRAQPVQDPEFALWNQYAPVEFKMEVNE